MLIPIWATGCAAACRLSQCCLLLTRLFELGLSVSGSMSALRLPCSWSLWALGHCSRVGQGFWSFWSHFNMTFIPRPWRVVSKACTACSRGKRWVTRGLTFTLPDASMAMAMGQLQHRPTSTLFIQHSNWPVNNHLLAAHRTEQELTDRCAHVLQ